ncbi:MAG: restriction endonuclease subunit S [Planctomycetota bacterium]|nr:restriction endonuclease subunit S [Planctomycetota bacterium]
MADDWQTASLRDAGVTLMDCDHRTPPPASVGIPYVAIPQLKGGRLDLSDVRLISPEHFSDWTKKAKPQYHDVILSRRCNPGETAYVPNGLQCALGQNLVLLRSDGQSLFPPFLRWWLRGPDWWNQVRKFINVGAVFESLKCAEIPNFEMPLPPLPEQRAIASVLGALDDKIELNRRMNATLESMARALFQSWFIDFDPVRAKLDNRHLTGMDAETAALFPDSFQDSNLGPIPHGWEVDTIKNRASNIQYGFTQSATVEPIGPHFLRITDLRGGTIDWGSVPYCEATGASTGDNIYVVEPPPTVFASYLIRVQFTSRGIGRLVGEFTRTADYANHVAGTIGGSAQPNASAQALAAASLVYPSEGIANAFYRLVRPLDLRRAANDRESRTLTTLRDTLLPKLLSGKFSVVGAEVMENA